MLFNSVQFAIFLPIVFILYWFLTGKNLKLQNMLLLVASYFFYACWDWRFLFLLMFSTLLDFASGILIEQAQSVKRKRFWLTLSIVINLGFLGFFKYYNFFVTSFTDSLSQLGVQINPWTLNVLLPVGISFYTFHGLSYVIDIYKDRIKAEKNFVEYAVFVSFFPLLVAGPIERATHLLPQIKRERTFEYGKAVDGLKQILWGLFKKVVIADQCASFANMIFDNPSHYSGSVLVLGAICFAFQIYGDFSGYSDIALGTARLFGIELIRNFNYPYFSRDIAEFWRRWHISLSSWFRDYLYIPLGGSKVSTALKIRNTFIIFLVSGFWHGANWTFVIWGALNALFIMPSIIFSTNRKNIDIVAAGKYLPSFRDFIAIVITFSLTVFAWIFFRSDSVASSITYISGILSPSLFSFPVIKPSFTLIVLLILFVLVEWSGREYAYPIKELKALRVFNMNIRKPVRWAFYYLMIVSVLYFAGTKQEFIYFQF